MAQSDVLIQATNLQNTLRGPAKIYYATFNAAFPSNIYQAISATTGVPVAPWVSFGLTRGGINVGKTIDVALRDDVDQIVGAFDSDITGINYALTTQLAEVLDRVQLSAAFEMGVPTIVYATSSGPTQVYVPLDDGNLKMTEWRWAAVFPKTTAGKVIAFVFRRGQVQGGEKLFRFDKNDPASPALEIRLFPEISTAITADDAYGRFFSID